MFVFKSQLSNANMLVFKTHNGEVPLEMILGPTLILTDVTLLLLLCVCVFFLHLALNAKVLLCLIKAFQGETIFTTGCAKVSFTSRHKTDSICVVCCSVLSLLFLNIYYELINLTNMNLCEKNAQTFFRNSQTTCNKPSVNSVCVSLSRCV